MALTIKLLSEPSLEQNGKVLVLPKSRKARALLLYLVLGKKAQRRQSLCELLWQSNDDPRAALRWALAKLRPLLGKSLISDTDSIAIEINPVNCDLFELRLLLQDTALASFEKLVQREEQISGDYFPGVDCDGSIEFDLWLASQRSAMRELHGNLLEHLHDSPRVSPTDAIYFARKRVGIHFTSIPANLALLQLLLQHEGLDTARKAMEQCRQRLKKNQIDDTALLQQWRNISHASAITVSNRAAHEKISSNIDSAVQLVLPEKPSLAVLNFSSMGEGQNAVLAQGITTDLTSRLSRLSGLFVIARASSGRFSVSQTPLDEIGRHLGVRYLIHGTIQSHNNRMRVNVTLLEASTGEEVWSQHYDRSRDDLFLVQEEIANAVVSAVEPEIERAEFERAKLKHPQSLDAWENYHMALWHCFRFTLQDTEAASIYLQHALTQDPTFSRVHSAMSLNHFARAFLNAVPDTSTEIALACNFAEQGLALDNRDAMGHWSLGRAKFLDQQHDLALSSIDRALQANPNYAQGHYARGFIGVHSGIASAALPNLSTAVRLSPFDPLLFAMKSSKAVSYIMQGDYETAANWGIRATIEANAHYHIYAVAAAALELAGRSHEAQRNIQVACSRRPGYCRKEFFSSFPYKLPEQHQLVADALARAGLPE